jgi:hypothetical protein
VAGPQGFEPQTSEPELEVLPLHHRPKIELKRTREIYVDRCTGTERMAGPQGFEPQMTAPKTVVLPLHHRPKKIGLKEQEKFMLMREEWYTLADSNR